MLRSLSTAAAALRIGRAAAPQIHSIWRMEVLSPGEKVGTPAKVISSPQGDWNPSFSPDARRVVFESLRGKTRQNWVANSDGSNAEQLTWLEGGVLAGSPRWSPDGHSIAFDATDGIIRVVPSAGGKAVALTDGAFRNSVPAWSGDSRSLYFASNRSGRSEMWKTPVQGGEAVQVTRNGGHVARESPDGRFLYFLKPVAASAGSLWKLTLGGNQESQVIDSVVYRAFAVTGKGIYFFAPADAGTNLCYLDVATQERRILTVLRQRLHNGFSLSGDERSILYSVAAD
jgi:Tol biopolymer transport system component